MKFLSSALLVWSPMLFIGLAGCGGQSSAFEQALAAGDRAKSSGRYDDAAAAYQEAGDAAKKGRDRDEGYFLAAATLEQAGRHQEAMAAYDQLIVRSPKGERTPRAVFERGLLEVQYGDAEAGWKALEAAIWAYPGAGSARRVLRKYLEHLDEKRPGAGDEWLRANQERLLTTELGEDALYLMAKALQAEGKISEARAQYEKCAERYPYPYGTLTDDAWWNAAELAEQQGDSRAAIVYLEKLLAPREVSTMKQGSYERPRYSAAQFKLAEIYRDKLGEDEQARRAFHRLYEDFKTSILRDDALWNEMLLARKAKEDSKVCELMQAMVQDFPESRYSGCAPQLCASMSAPAKAPPCRGYLKSVLGIE